MNMISFALLFKFNPEFGKSNTYGGNRYPGRKKHSRILGGPREIQNPRRNVCDEDVGSQKSHKGRRGGIVLEPVAMSSMPEVNRFQDTHHRDIKQSVKK